jgi:hypothetical protein
MQMPRSRLAVLKALWRHGNVVDKSGFAMGHIVERVREFDQLSFNVNAVVNAPLMQLCVERVTKGRRTMKVSLVALPQTWLRLVEGALSEQGPPEQIIDVSPMAAVAANLGIAGVAYSPDAVTVALAPETDSRLSPPPPPPEYEVASAVATALMAQVVDIIMSNGGAVLGVKNAQLKDEVLQLTQRLGEQTAYAQRLRRELDQAKDTLAATILERDGLRMRAQEAERNLKIATGADAQRLIDVEVHKALDKMMRQKPESTKAS